MSFRHALFATALCAAVGAMPARADLLGNLKSQIGGGNAGTGLGLPSGLGGGSGMAALGLPAIGGDTLSNAAGVIEYCVKNNYLQGGSAQSVKERLLGKVGLAGAKTQQDAGYQSGLVGMLKGSDGSSFDMGRLQSQLKEKACDYVLKQGQSLL
ncbi:DUF2501 domain-containing protein [Xylophilus sp. ASV27]|uniref:DUF2501 domain-containing protein n=1 Tax=Xylophilus sp. ASV27 TaxID=2795129 RepID=UPI0018EDBCD0|nr:DUF2501 domain-containing protein [Xylophilus sp. ASV27]